MAKLEVIGGDLDKKDWKAEFSTFLDKPTLIEDTGIFSSVKHDLEDELVFIEQVTEETKYSIFQKIGWGIVGGMLTGGLGVLAGVVLGGNDKEVSFVAELANGKRWVGVADTDTYKKLVIYATKNKGKRLASPNAQTIVIEQPPEKTAIGAARCPNCGAQIAPEFKFCPACGAENLQ